MAVKIEDPRQNSTEMRTSNCPALQLICGADGTLFKTVLIPGGRSFAGFEGADGLTFVRPHQQEKREGMRHPPT
jgi:hypothetical protein